MAVKSKLRGEAARLAILDSAHDLFSDLGVDAVTMAQVATAAGVSRATVFNHFGSKHALVEAITVSVYRGYIEMLRRAMEDRLTPTPVLVRVLFETMGWGIESEPRFYRSVFREIALQGVGLVEGSEAYEARAVAFGLLVQLVTRGQARGDIVRTMEADDLASSCDSIVFGTITRWLYDDASEPLEKRMSRAAQVFLGGVAANGNDVFEGPDPVLAVPPETGPLRRS